MTTHFNYSLQNFSTNNAKVLTGNSQPVPDFMALCNQGIISRENISGIDNSNGNLISHEKILGIDNSNLPLENKEDAKAGNDEKKKADTEAKARGEEEHFTFNDLKRIRKTKHTLQCAQNSNLIKYRLLYENENLYDLMFANSTLNIQIFRRFKEARTNTTRDLLFNCNDEYDPTRKSILSELLQISKCGLRAADIFFNKFLSEMQKTEADQEADQDVDQNLDQESDQEAYQTADQHAD